MSKPVSNWVSNVLAILMPNRKCEVVLMEIQFMKPKKKLQVKSNWNISEHTKAIVKYFAEYTGYDEDEVVDDFLKNLLKDPDFIEWINSKRRNKRMMSQLYPNDDEDFSEENESD